LHPRSFSLLALAALCAPRAPAIGQDLREDYDVLTYRLDLRIDPEQRELSGDVAVEVRFERHGASVIELDLARGCRVHAVALQVGELTPDRSLAGRPLRFEHVGDTLRCVLEQPSRRGQVATVVVSYSAKPSAVDRFTGFFWDHSEDGRPWISTSCQAIGAQAFWPCKSSFFHPEDKCERLFVNLTVPRGLTAISNGRLHRRSRPDEGRETFHWRHDYPLETYSVTFNVGPFVEVATLIELPELEDPVPFVYWVLPESEERAKVQFAEVPRILAAFSAAFGPYPFPLSKVGIVETSFFGMEHSTAIAYGSNYPAWRAEQGLEDRNRQFNLSFDYILVHELAHEWWGNAVSAVDWRDFWLHEGFATYAESVYVEHMHGRAAADDFFEVIGTRVGRHARLCAPAGSSSSEAYSRDLYYKGAWVLNTLRHYLDDDETWWRTLREFQGRYRYANASTEDFRAVLEATTGRDWERFFEEWVYGSGAPRLTGEVWAEGDSVRLRIDNESTCDSPFHVPIDLTWTVRGEASSRRFELDPGCNELAVDCDGPAEDLRVVNLQRLLGRHRVLVR